MGTTEIKENKDIEVVENAEVVEDAEAVEAVQEIRPYTLRNPKASDIASFLKLFSKVGIRDLKGAFNSDETKNIIKKSMEDGGDVSKAVEDIGIGFMFEIADTILVKLSECQTEVFKCLSCLSGMKVEQIADLDLPVFTEMLFDAVTLPGFADFIKVVSRLYKKMQ
jgi:hypothetical protein|nr:MAG TPA: hypothetical protein [Caudoviricetes sp.]